MPPLSIMRALWKRKLLAGTISLIVAAVGVAVVYALPAIYRSETLILVESQRIPEDFVKPTVETNLQDRLSTLSQQIMSYTRLLEVVKQFDLYKRERETKPEEEIIQQMREDIQVTLEKGWSRDRPGAFRIAYEGKDPQVVARVANRLGNLFIDENLRTREVQAVGTSEFLDTQLAEAGKRLQEQEARLGQYKLKYSGQLPQQENALIAELARLQLQLQGVQDAMNRAQQNKVMTESILAAAQESTSALEDVARKVAAGIEDSSGTLRAGSAALANSAMIQRELDLLLTRYTENHPAVRSVRELLARTKERERNEASLEPQQAGQQGADAAASRPKENERAIVLSQSLLRERERVKGLQAQLEVTSQQLSVLEEDRQALLKRIEAVQARVSSLPLREQEMASVTRDYEISKANYQSLLDKKLAAQMATEMERRQKSERFTILDVARVPEKPVRPNRPLFASLSGLVAVLLGFGIGLGLERRAGTVLGEWEMPRDIPILGRVPIIPEDEASGERAVRRRKLRLAAAMSVLVLAVAGALGAGIYLGWFSV